MAHRPPRIFMVPIVSETQNPEFTFLYKSSFTSSLSWTQNTPIKCPNALLNLPSRKNQISAEQRQETQSAHRMSTISAEVENKPHIPLKPPNKTQKRQLSKRWAVPHLWQPQQQHQTQKANKAQNVPTLSTFFLSHPLWISTTAPTTTTSFPIYSFFHHPEIYKNPKIVFEY